MSRPDADPPTPTAPAAEARAGSLPVAVLAGAAVGLLGGLIGLGGAEFRLPLLIGLFGFAALQAVVLNKAMSLIVVVTALPTRLAATAGGTLLDHWPVVLNLLAGSLVGAWVGASLATRMRSATLHRVLALLLVVMAGGLAWHLGDPAPLALDPTVRALLVGRVSEAVLIPLLVALLIASAVRVWRHP